MVYDQDAESSVSSEIEKHYYMHMNKWYFYIARCQDKSLYIGITHDADKRIKRHNQGDGAKWIKQHGNSEIVYTEMYDNYMEAHRRETQVKKW
jgi:putative endonuclease